MYDRPTILFGRFSSVRFHPIGEFRGDASVLFLSNNHIVCVICVSTFLYKLATLLKRKEKFHIAYLNTIVYMTFLTNYWKDRIQQLQLFPMNGVLYITSPLNKTHPVYWMSHTSEVIGRRVSGAQTSLMSNHVWSNGWTFSVNSDLHSSLVR